MFRSARIDQRTDWAEGLSTIKLDLDGPAFQPGQFFNLALLGPNEAPIRRSYSAASAPNAPLEFMISEVKEGALTPQIFRLSVGDELLLDDAPLGFFTLGEVPEAKHLWLLATGTGLGPYISMLREGKGLERFERVIVVHGVTGQSRLANRPELEAAAQAGRIVYLPLTSRETPPAFGLSGRITTRLEDGALEEAAGVPIDGNSHILLCGNPLMIEETTGHLKARGLSKHRRRTPGHFNFEKYW